MSMLLTVLVTAVVLLNFKHHIEKTPEYLISIIRKAKSVSSKFPHRLFPQQLPQRTPRE